MRRTLAVLLAGCAATAALPASATTRFPKQFTCPVGGEVFQDHVIGSYTSWGSRPDGRPYGTLLWPPLPECPGNGFLLVQEDFTPQEIAILTPLVASAEYQAMRTGETMHYRAWWLQAAIRPTDAAALARTLLVASWQSDEDPERKARYQRAFVAAADAVPLDDPSWLGVTLRAANARRELGDFPAAEAALAAAQLARSAWPQADAERKAMQSYASGLATLAAERNGAAEPANLVPAEQAVERCTAMQAALSAEERIACVSAPYQEAIARRNAEEG